MINRKIKFLIFLAIISGLGGCLKIEGKLPTVQPNQNPNGFKVGAAKFDITPPPGFPLGGYGPAGALSKGYWTRLYTRAIFIEDQNGTRLALVSNDLWSISGGLGDKVAEGLGEGPCAIPRENIIIAATHTHHSPGSFSTHPMYNDHSSFVGGFDEKFFYFLVNRIQTAIRTACIKSENAKVFYEDGKLDGFMHNRSLPAFKKNREVQNTQDLNRLMEMSIDNSLQVLWFRPVSDLRKTIAIAGFFAVHNTVLHPKTPTYNGDLYGIASLMLENELLKNSVPSKPAVVAFFTGAQGDMAPNTPHRNRVDLLNLGQKVKNETVQLERSLRSINEDINISYFKPNLKKVCLEEGYDNYPESMCTDDIAVPGTAMIGGAEAGRTLFYHLGWQEGVIRSGNHTNSPQGAKLPAFKVNIDSDLFNWLDITKVLVKEGSVPENAPLGFYKIGEVVIATLPGEFTMTMGKRIRDSLKKMLKRDGPILLVGLANEYISYFSTPEEFQEQHYEGASTLYGKASGPVVQSLLEKATRRNQKLTKRSFEYKPGKDHEFGPSKIFFTNPKPWRGLEKILIDINNYPNVETNYPYFCWEDIIPEFPPPTNKSQISDPYQNIHVTPRVYVHKIESSVSQPYQDDSGLNFVTTTKRIINEFSMEWCAFWLHIPASTTNSTNLFQFKVIPISGTYPAPICSKLFRDNSQLGMIEADKCI